MKKPVADHCLCGHQRTHHYIKDITDDGKKAGRCITCLCARYEHFGKKIPQKPHRKKYARRERI